MRKTPRPTLKKRLFNATPDTPPNAELLAKKLKKKKKKKKVDTSYITVDPEIGILSSDIKGAEILPEEISESPFIVKRYPDQPCSVEGCDRYAIGKGDTCRKHGGSALIRENLMFSGDMPTTIVGVKYDRGEHPILFIELAKEGASEVEIAAEIGVSVYTLRGWAEKFKEFNSAYEIGQALHEAWWLKEGKENLDNRGYNVSLFKFLTGNKLGYSEKMESKNLHVHAGVLQVPAKMSAEEWESSVGDKDAKKIKDKN